MRIAVMQAMSANPDARVGIVMITHNRCGEVLRSLGHLLRLPERPPVVVVDNSAEACAAAYLREIERVGRGIVLLHDSSEDPVMRRNNRTFDVTKFIVPVLNRSYRLADLDEVPAIRAVTSAEWAGSCSATAE
jgi:hypothetical protein